MFAAVKLLSKECSFKLLIGVTSYRIDASEHLLNLTRRCLTSIVNQKASFPFEVLLSDQRSNMDVLLKLQREFGVKLNSEMTDCVSRSWNLICERGFNYSPYVLIVANDVEFYPNALEPLVAFGKQNPKFIVMPSNEWLFSTFLINKDMYSTVGFFDENLKGGDLVDWDYCERMKEKNVEILFCKEWRVNHVRCATKGFFVNDPQMQKLLEDSIRYYRKKWGDGGHKLP